MADNILNYGLVADNSEAHPMSDMLKSADEEEKRKALAHYNEVIMEEKRVETFLLPIFDGLGMGRLID